MSATARQPRKLVTALVVALALASALTLTACSERAVRGSIQLLLCILTGDERSEWKRRQRVCELTGQECEPYRAGSGREEESC